MAKKRPKAGASTSAPTAEHLHGQHGYNATDALVARVAEATAKATVKGLKPVVKPVLQHVYGPRSSSSAQSKYRPAALQHYTGEPQPAEATCAVSGVKLPVQDLVAGHIYQRRWPPTSHVNIDDPSNIMLMHRNVEQLFNNFELTVTPVELEVVVLRKQRIWTGELFQGFLQDSASVTASGSSSGADSGSCRDANITDEAGATDEDANITDEAGATDEGGLSSSGGHRGSAGVSDEVVRDLAVSAQQQLKL
ncbi:hypothetical protein HYH03_011983 [Edaphochlamys debaryana]|uniref:HNH nuclease domain-containing protein n=1 Tax=Edaphochlamys debaryana TaxID=47281 RepID=A0A835XTS3_9CHLO|nr:hypothetical protein HYH03_011983 [Edaphochlamys debaryana]|eukprot:KAG2489532.1 hypothetical protein HYH03_011983 [Edaphochlamys debaryana]